MTNGPDYTHGGEFVDWGDVPLDERFVPQIELARRNIGTDVELMRWSPDDPVLPEIERMWGKQRDAVRRHVGPLTGMKLTTTSRTHKDLGMKIAYVRFNRTRLAVARDEATA
jgi:hypothetical protein